MNIAGSVAVVTGAARNIGLTIARSLAAAGARVVLGDVLEQELAESVAAIQAAGGQAVGVVADVRWDRDVARLMDTAIERFGALNIVCANAGIIRDGLVLNRDPATGRIDRVLSTEDFRDVLDVNMTGTFITLREGARRIVDSAAGRACSSPSRRSTTPVSRDRSTTRPARLRLRCGRRSSSANSTAAASPTFASSPITPGYTGDRRVEGDGPGLAQRTADANVHLRRLVEPEELASTIKHVVENDAIDATTIEVTAGATYGPWQRAR